MIHRVIMVYLQGKTNFSLLSMGFNSFKYILMILCYCTKYNLIVAMNFNVFLQKMVCVSFIVHLHGIKVTSKLLIRLLCDSRCCFKCSLWNWNTFLRRPITLSVIFFFKTAPQNFKFIMAVGHSWSMCVFSYVMCCQS